MANLSGEGVGPVPVNTTLSPQDVLRACSFFGELHMPRGWERDKGRPIAHGYNVRLPAFGFHIHVSLRSAILIILHV